MDTPTDFESTSGLSLEYLQTMNAQSQSQNLSTETYHPDLNASLLNTPFIPLESDYSVYSESIPLQSDYSVYSQSTSREELHSRIQILSEEQVNHLLEYIRAQEQPDFSTVPTDGLPEWFDEDEFLSFCASPFGTSLAPMTTSLPPMTTSLPVDSIALPTALLAPGTNDTMTCCQCACTSALSRIDSGCGQCGHECESCLISPAMLPAPATLEMDHELGCCACGTQGFALVGEGRKECCACGHGACEDCWYECRMGGIVRVL